MNVVPVRSWYASVGVCHNLVQLIFIMYAFVSKSRPIAKHIVHATISEDRKMKTITFDPGSLSQEGRSFRDRLVRKFLQYRTGAVVFESKAMAHDHETEQIFVDNPLANCVS